MSARDATKAEALVDQGRAHLDAGERARAEECFRAAATLTDQPVARNNWALCRYLSGAPAEALKVLAPVLAAETVAPFSHALASLAHTAIGNPKAAGDELRAAMRDLDAGLISAQWRGAEPEPALIEYTMLIKQAAGALGNDRLILELHGRWPGRDLPSGAFLAGVAAFHLGKYAQAAKYWRRISALEWVQPMQAYVRAAELAESGLVPPFRLEYSPIPDEEEALMAAGDTKALSERGSVRVRLLAALFEPGFPDKGTMVSGLIGSTGAWGVEFGRRLLAGNSVPMEIKTSAAGALIEAGEFAPNEPIPIVHQGRATTITVNPIAVNGDDAAAAEVVQRAKRLRDAGRNDEALQLLSDLVLRGVAYPPALMMQANLMRTAGDLDGARPILESLEKIAPDDPAVLLNLAGLWMQYENWERAGSYANRIDTAGTTKEFQRIVSGMKAQLRQMEQLAYMPSVEEIADAMREEMEEKPISLTVTLAAALRQIPVQWLNAAAALHAVAPTKRRGEREKALAAVLKEPVRLQAALTAEPAVVRDCMQYLAEAGGWCKLQALTKRFGALDGDGFYWDEQPPTSPIGRLRLLGLLFVGRAEVEGRRYKVAVIPTDLRPLLQSKR